MRSSIKNVRNDSKVASTSSAKNLKINLKIRLSLSDDPIAKRASDVMTQTRLSQTNWNGR